MEYERYFSKSKKDIFGSYFPIEYYPFEKLKFPVDGIVVWDKKNGKVLYKNEIYYGLYHEGLVKGIYNTNYNSVTNLIQDPTRYYNICVGIIDYLFSRILLQKGIFRVHAGGISKNGTILLICGPKGSGKTTLLMKLIQNGYPFISDDQTFLYFEGNRLYCIPFPKTLKINYSDIDNLPFLYNHLKYLPIITSDGTKKAIIKPELNNFPIITQKLPITQIIIPTISKTQLTNIKVLSGTEAFNLLIPAFRGDDLLNIDYLYNQNLLNTQKSFCERVNSYCNTHLLSMGKDFKEINISFPF